MRECEYCGELIGGQDAIDCGELCRACEGTDGCLICGDIYSVPDGYEDEGLCWDCERNALEAAITSLRDKLAEAKADNARLREELEWYGEQARLARLIHSEGDAGRHALSEDGGKRAKAALTPPPTANEGATTLDRSWLGELQDLTKPPVERSGG